MVSAKNVANNDKTRGISNFGSAVNETASHTHTTNTFSNSTYFVQPQHNDTKKSETTQLEEAIAKLTKQLESIHTCYKFDKYDGNSNEEEARSWLDQFEPYRMHWSTEKYFAFAKTHLTRCARDWFDGAYKDDFATVDEFQAEFMRHFGRRQSKFVLLHELLTKKVKMCELRNHCFAVRKLANDSTYSFDTAIALIRTQIPQKHWHAFFNVKTWQDMYRIAELYENECDTENKCKQKETKK